MGATEADRLELIQYLVEEGGADVDYRDRDYERALSHAAYDGYLSIVRYLVEEAGSDVFMREYSGDEGDDEDAHGCTVLGKACKHPQFHVVEYLVQQCNMKALEEDFYEMTSLDHVRDFRSRYWYTELKGKEREDKEREFLKVLSILEQKARQEQSM